MLKKQQTLRSHKIFKHVLGTDSSNDELVFEEKMKLSAVMFISLRVINIYLLDRIKP